MQCNCYIDNSFSIETYDNKRFTQQSYFKPESIENEILYKFLLLIQITHPEECTISFSV